MRSIRISISLLLVSSLGWSFGWDGNPGGTGQKGIDGRSGPNIEVTAEGQSELFDLSGTNGDNGRDGEYGQNATGCTQPTNSTSNEKGADGGNGGQGGTGGNGGNGGDITVYYLDSASLKKIFVRANPGRGGYGGRGAQGGHPCYCSMQSWTVNGQTYYCSNGNFGNYGSTGNTGNSGSYGKIKLIGQLSPPSKEVTSLSIPFIEMGFGRYELSKHRYESRQGARTLFAAGSDITDNYTLYTGTSRKAFTFEWNSPRPVTDFAKQSVLIALGSNGSSVDVSNGIWYEGTETVVSSDETHISFDKVVFSSEANQYKFGQPTSSGTSLEIPIIDEAKVSDTVSTSVSLRYYTFKNGYFHKRWEGTLPTEITVASADQVRMLLGKLPVSSEYLASQLRVYIEITVTRSLGKYKRSSYYQLNRQIP